MALERTEKEPLRGRGSSLGQAGVATLPPDGDVGSALRSVFEQAVNEDIPAEMLDLLHKLG